MAAWAAPCAGALRLSRNVVPLLLARYQRNCTATICCRAYARMRRLLCYGESWRDKRTVSAGGGGVRRIGGCGGGTSAGDSAARLTVDVKTRQTFILQAGRGRRS